MSQPFGRARRYAALALVPAAALLGLAIATGTAEATTPNRTGQCVTVTHGGIGDIAVAPLAGLVLTGDGVQVTTNDQGGKVSWSAAVDIDMDDITGLSYTTTKQDSSANKAGLASYVVAIKTSKGTGSIIFEPYYNLGTGDPLNPIHGGPDDKTSVYDVPGDGNPDTAEETRWNVLNGKFWTGAAGAAVIDGMVGEGGGSYANNRTWNEIKAANPDARIVAFGFNQGTYNAGVITLVNDVKLAAKSFCKVHKWSASYTSPTPSASATPSASTSASPSVSASVSPSASVSVSPSASGSASVSPSVTPVSPTPPGSPSASTSADAAVPPVARPGGGLPLTGSKTLLYVGGGLALLVGGAVLLIATRQRREQLTVADDETAEFRTV